MKTIKKIFSYKTMAYIILFTLPLIILFVYFYFLRVEPLTLATINYRPSEPPQEWYQWKNGWQVFHDRFWRGYGKELRLMEYCQRWDLPYPPDETRAWGAAGNPLHRFDLVERLMVFKVQIPIEFDITHDKEGFARNMVTLHTLCVLECPTVITPLSDWIDESFEMFGQDVTLDLYRRLERDPNIGNIYKYHKYILKD